MAYVNLNDDQLNVTGGNDSIVLIKDVADIPGGAPIDVTNVAQGTEVIKAGHIITQNKTTKIYSPLQVAENEYVIPEDANVVLVGVLKQTISVKKPLGAITTIGEVNAAASPYPITDAIVEALPAIKFIYR